MHEMIALGFLFMIIGAIAAAMLKLDEYSSRGRALCVILPMTIGASLIVNFGLVLPARGAMLHGEILRYEYNVYVWIDPDTSCHYITSIDSILVPRQGRDGKQICEVKK